MCVCIYVSIDSFGGILIDFVNMRMLNLFKSSSFFKVEKFPPEQSLVKVPWVAGRFGFERVAVLL